MQPAYLKGWGRGVEYMILFNFWGATQINPNIFPNFLSSYPLHLLPYRSPLSVNHPIPFPYLTSLTITFTPHRPYAFESWSRLRLMFLVALHRDEDRSWLKLCLMLISEYYPTHDGCLAMPAKPESSFL